MSAELKQDRYAWWKNALKGIDQPIHEDQPQAGFYRARRREGGWDPVAIWWDRDQWKCARAGRAADAYAIWTWVCRNPVTEAEWRKVDQGGEWSDAPPPAPAAGHNLPSDPAERLAVLLAEESETWKRWIGEGPIADDDRAAAAAALIKRWAASEKEAEETRVREKRPHDDAAKAVQAKWAPIVKGFSDLRTTAKRAMDDHLRKKQEDERAAAREAALQAAAIGAPPPAVEPARVGNTGEAITLRTYYRGQILDMAVFLTANADNPDIIAAAQKVADAAARAKVATAGMKIITEQRAA